MSEEILYQYSNIVIGLREAESKVKEIEEQYKGYKIIHSIDMIDFATQKFKLEIQVYNEKVNSR